MVLNHYVLPYKFKHIIFWVNNCCLTHHVILIISVMTALGVICMVIVHNNVNVFVLAEVSEVPSTDTC